MRLYDLKGLVSRTARRLGYKIERITEEDVSPIDVFEMLVTGVVGRLGADFFFVQVGAHDGKSDDPIRRYVEEYRWRGILMEPQPLVFAELARNYRDQPQLILVNEAVGSADGEQTMYLPDEGCRETAGTFLATFDEGVLRRRIGRAAPVRTIRVPTVTPRTLLARHGVRSVDLLQIDAEGFDFEVIKMFDASGIRPTLIRFEHYNMSNATRRGCIDFLAVRGYRMFRDGIDVIAALPAGGVGGLLPD